jgi:hypothetical protein
MATLSRHIGAHIFPGKSKSVDTLLEAKTLYMRSKQPSKRPISASDSSSSSQEPASESFEHENHGVTIPQSPPTSSSQREAAAAVLDDRMDVEISSSLEDDKKRSKKKERKVPLTPHVLQRPSRIPLKHRSPLRRPFSTRGLVAVNSRWRPPMKPTMQPMHDGATHRAMKEEERQMRLQHGLPRNVQPVVITTKYRQYKLDPEDLLKGCATDKDRKFMSMVANNGRLLPVERWKRYTLVQGETYNHDMGIFTALDLALITIVLNFYTDMRRLMQGRRQKIRVSDVQYMINNVWANQVHNTSKMIWQPHFKTTKPVRLRHRHETEKD